MKLALDLGSRTGWAYERAGRRTSGFVDFKNSRFEGGGMRYLRFRQWLDKFPPGDVEAVYFEEVRRHRGVDAAHVYGGLLAQLTAWCEERQIPYQGIPVGTIKRHATGKGNAKKDAMIAAANTVGCRTDDDNEADAWWILDYALFVEVFT